jgi:hypothetical protein
MQVLLALSRNRASVTALMGNSVVCLYRANDSATRKQIIA